MEIIVNTEYIVVKNVIHKSVHSSVELAKHLYSYNISSKEELENLILDYYWDISTPNIVKNEDVHDVDEITDQFIENLPELVDYFNYLIKKEVELEQEFVINCCDGQTGKYCSECGKKLK